MDIISTFFTKKEFWTDPKNCAYKLDSRCYKHIFHKKRNFGKIQQIVLISYIMAIIRTFFTQKRKFEHIQQIVLTS